MGLALLAVAALIGIWWWSRTSELFCVSIRDGRLLVVRGRAPRGLVSEFARVAKQAGIRRGTIRALKTERGGRLVISGPVGEGECQQLRNIFGLYPASQLRQAPAIDRPSLGQLLGVAWLAWLIEGLIRRDG